MKPVNFFDGRALVRKGNLYGYIDEKGTYVIPPKYVSATPFSEGVAWTVEADGAPTLIDTDGNTPACGKRCRKSLGIYRRNGQGLDNKI